jgi:endonuclease/exonuclease/phosphatase family metal-dependent hydrolase
MRFFNSFFRRLHFILFPATILFLNPIFAQSNVNVRIMAANLNGNTQSYQPFALRILQGLTPDVVCIQEFNYSNNAASDFRYMLDTTFGTNFVYYREPYTANGAIPNGIISRYPILNSGSWADPAQSQPNRGFAWAQIQLPGTNSLYAVSVHLLTTSAANRATEAVSLQNMIQSNFPSNAWIVVAGDFNTDSRTESCMTTFDSYLSDYPIPADNNGNSDTSENRDEPHDYVLPSFSFTNLETASIFPSHTFPNGLVFDSTVYTPLSDVPPIQFGDSTNAQHMAVLKDFLISANGSITNPPTITSQPQNQSVAAGNSVTFSVTANGTAPLNFQWLFNNTNISGATTNPFTIAAAQLTDAGNYSVIITNIVGSITSSNAVLVVTNAPPSISSQPQNQTVLGGQTVTFNVIAAGTLPLNFQWIFNGTNISGATTNFYSLANVQLTNAGNYSVIITNISGSVTSAVATLTIVFTNPVVFAQWNFNSLTPDANTATGTTAPSIGSGTASLVGGTTATFATGDTNLDPAFTTDNSAWNTTGYPASTSNNKTAGAQFAVSTAGKQNIFISWSQQSSKTGGKYFRLQYSTNNGANFIDYATAGTLPLAVNFYAFTNNLTSAPGVNNNSNFVFRIVGEFESTALNDSTANYVAANTGSTYATSGTSRFDMVSVSGISYAAAPAQLTSGAIVNNIFSFNVSGGTGVNYVIQTSTNLISPNWISVYTNTSPFIFSDFATNQQKFYRALAQ